MTDYALSASVAGEPSAYVRRVLGRRDPVLESVLRRSLLDDGMPAIQVDDNAGRVLQLLTLIARPMHALEIGTLFGYSTIHIARGLPPGGRLTSLEIDPHSAEVARRNLQDAGLSEAVEVITCDALRYLADDGRGPFDLIFIDGEKLAYPAYLKACFPVLAPGGVLIADDAFASGDYGAELDDKGPLEAKRAITAYNRAVLRATTTLHSAFVGTETGLMVSVRL